jgi:transcription elongation factor GreB
LSRAFVKEDAAQPDEDPPERPVSPHPNYCTPNGLRRLEEAASAISRELETLAGVQTDSGKKKRKRTLERDLRYFKTRLETAIPVDPAATPKDEIRFGAKVTLRDENGERILRIVGEDEAEAGGELIPWAAPLAQALFGLKAGQTLVWDEKRLTVAKIAYGD